MKRVLLVFLSLFLFGCQSKKDAVEVVCQAPFEMDDNVKNMDPASAIRGVENHIKKNVRNAEVIGILSEMDKMDVRQRMKVLRELQKDVGLPHCGLLDFYGTRARLIKH